MSAQFTLEMCATVENCLNTKTSYFGSSKSFEVIDVDTVKNFVTSACYDKQYTVFTLNERIGVKSPLFRGVAVLTRASAGLLQPRGSRLKLLKSAFNAEHFIRRLSWSISSHSGAIHS